jgi:hypothetical protein
MPIFAERDDLTPTAPVVPNPRQPIVLLFRDRRIADVIY